MKDYGNLWEGALEGESLNGTKNVVPLLKVQCENLRSYTRGRVFARFESVRTASFAEAFYPGVAEVARRVSQSAAIVADPESTGLTNANELYEAKRYAFDIHTDTYRFRLFTVMLNPVYPISLDFDEGVYLEAEGWMPGRKGSAESSCSVAVDNDDELMECFESAIKTKKVRYLVNRLAQDSDDSAD